jgi:tRNA nucleotidyltransferase (CCA-adding enzyme)
MEIYLHKLRYVKSALSGADLLKMGLTPGPQVKEVLARLHEAKLDGKAVTKQDEAALVRECLAKTT